MSSSSHHGLESTRNEKAQVRKLVYWFSATLVFACFLELLSFAYPGPLLRSLFFCALVSAAFLFFLLLGHARKLKSVLPPDMEAKRLAIAKSHNQLVMSTLLAVAMLWLAALLSQSSSILLCAVILTPAVCIGGFRYTIRHDNMLCRRLDYLCPLCGKPLYEPQSATYLTGLCPKCKRHVLSS